MPPDDRLSWFRLSRDATLAHEMRTRPITAIFPHFLSWVSCRLLGTLTNLRPAPARVRVAGDSGPERLFYLCKIKISI